MFKKLFGRAARPIEYRLVDASGSWWLTTRLTMTGLKPLAMRLPTRKAAEQAIIAFHAVPAARAIKLEVEEVN